MGNFTDGGNPAYFRELASLSTLNELVYSTYLKGDHPPVHVITLVKVGVSESS